MQIMEFYEEEERKFEESRCRRNKKNSPGRSCESKKMTNNAKYPKDPYNFTKNIQIATRENTVPVFLNDSNLSNSDNSTLYQTNNSIADCSSYSRNKTQEQFPKNPPTLDQPQPIGNFYKNIYKY